MTAEDRSGELDQVRFMQLISMFQVAAMQQLGKLPNPATSEIERNLDQARASIDMLEMLKRRSEGNRSGEETEFIDRVLFELHMNYVDEVRSDKEEKEEDAGAEEKEEKADAPRQTAEEESGGDSEPEKQ